MAEDKATAIKPPKQVTLLVDERGVYQAKYPQSKIARGAATALNAYPALAARAERLAGAVQRLSEVSDDALVYGISDDDARLLRDAWAEINAALAALKAGA